jgi:hypothetical protein
LHVGRQLGELALDVGDLALGRRNLIDRRPQHIDRAG